MRRAGYSVAYADGAVAYTEAPDTLRGLAKQRFRWSFGTLQCTWKHRDAFFRRKYGSLGLIALPNVFLFQLLLPAISPIADLMFVYSIVSVWINAGSAHGGRPADVRARRPREGVQRTTPSSCSSIGWRRCSRSSWSRRRTSSSRG